MSIFGENKKTSFVKPPRFCRAFDKSKAIISNTLETPESPEIEISGFISLVRCLSNSTLEDNLPSQ